LDDGVRRQVRETAIALKARRAMRLPHWGLLIAGAWTVIGIVTGVLRLLLMPRLPLAAPAFIALNVAFAWFWVPVTFVVASIAQWRSSDGTRARSALWLLVIAGVLSLLVQPLWLHVVLKTIGARSGPYLAQLLTAADGNVVHFAAVVAVVLAAISYRESLAAELATMELEEALVEAHVKVLTMQLQPHFLFNTLHLVSEEMFHDVASAKRTLGDLRRLLVESLSYAARREVTLREEMGFLESYVAIQDRRFRGRLSVEIDVAPDVPDARVPHLILQPLVENAIRHGIAPRAEGGTVRVCIRRNGAALNIVVEDDGVGLTRVPSQRPPGLGVTQTRARLTHLYGESGTLWIAGREGGGTATRVSIPFHTTSIEAPGDSVSRSYRSSDQLLVPANPWSIARVVTLVFAGWIAMAIVCSQLMSAAFAAADVPALPWLAIVKGHFVIAITGMVISWPAIRLVLALPRDARRLMRTVFVHPLVGIAIGAAHVWITLAVFAAIARVNDGSAAFASAYRGSAVAWIVWDMIAYLAVVALVNRTTFATWHRNTVLEADRLRVTVAIARLELVRLQFQPAVLLEGLDGVARAAESGAQCCEDVITRFGDVLRQMLSGADVGVDEMRRAVHGTP
jgi:two-component system LytT family sensor kinase